MSITSKISLLVLLAASCTGCTLPIANSEDQLPSVNNRFPIRVEPQVAALTLPVAPDGSLHEEDGQRVRAFAETWKARGYGVLGVAPAGAGATDKAVREIRNILSAADVGDDSIRTSASLPGEAGAMTQVSLSFLMDAAVAEACGATWQENIGEEPRNLPYQDFACTSNRNLAALLEDPRDLVQPRRQDPADTMRRGLVIHRYRNGESTAAAPEPSSDGGLVSNVAR